MGTAVDGMALIALGVAAAVAALSAAWLAAAGLRRGVRRIAGQLRELRRHPLVGDLPEEPGRDLARLSGELNSLLADLRAQVRRQSERATGLQALADGPSHIALVGLDAGWEVTAFSRGASTLTGWPAVEILGHHVEALFAAGEWERILPKLARRSLRDEGIIEKVRLQRRDGGGVPVELTVEGGGGDAAGGPGLLLVARDLSAEEQLERQLRASETRYRRLVEEMRDGAIILKAGRIAYANPAIGRLLGAPDGAIQGRPFKDIVHSHDLLRVLEHVRRAEAGEAVPQEIQCRLCVPGGTPIEARMAWAATEFEGGPAVLSTVVDLTERARLEKAVSDSEARLRATLNATDDGLLLVEGRPPGGAVSVVNRAFCDLFDLPPGALLGLPPAEAWRVLSERCADPGAMRDLAARAENEAHQEGLGIVAGRRAVVDVLAGAVRAPDGHMLGLILTVRDVTARVDGARRLQASFEELSHAKGQLEATCRDLAAAQGTLSERNRQLEELNTELRSLDEMKSNLLANVSHELHTPLVSIKGYTEMVVRRRLGPLTPEQERGLSVALKNIDRLIEMIDNLLSFARMEKGETQLALEDVPLWQLVDEAIEMVGERVKKKNLSVTTQYENDDLVVRGDRARLTQVFTNLMTNAVKFNRDGGRITVSARRLPKGLAEIRVADTGIGIAPEDQQRIFERFCQVESGPGRRYEGTGIGLSIVRDSLRLHGCSIRVESEPGKGSIFSFTLPLVRAAAPAESRPPATRGRSSD